MGEPVSATIAAISAAATIASTVSAVQGAKAQAKAQSQTADYNAQVANQNAYISNQQGEAAAEQQRRAAAQHMGAMIATYGASGVQGDTGSPMDVLADSAAKAALDGMTIKYNYTLRGMGFSNQAMLDASASKNYLTAGNTTAWADGLKGVAELGKQAGTAYRQYKGVSLKTTDGEE